jgi:hypothetical protein
MVKLVADTKNAYCETAIVHAPLDMASSALQSNGFEFITAPQNTDFRVQQGVKGISSYVCRVGNYVSNAVIYTREGNYLVTRSPLLLSPQQATELSRSGREFCFNKDVSEELMHNAIHFPLRDTEIPTNRFDSEPLTVRVFGEGDVKKATEYGKLLQELGIISIPVEPVTPDHVRSVGTIFARQLFLGRIDHRARSGLYARFKDIHFGDENMGNGFRGIRKIT